MTNPKALEVPDVAKKHHPKFSLGLLDEFPELKNWLNEICRRGKFEDFIFISDYKIKELIRFNIFTKDHYYAISARLPRKINEHIIQTDEKNEVIGESNAPIDDGYLGCIGQVRKARAGENWLRGNDLADGSYSYETWQEIVNDILAFELVKVVRNSPDNDEK